MLAGAAALGLALMSVPAHAAPLPSADPTQPPGSYSEQNLAADRTAQNFFYRIPALAYLGGGVVLEANDARPGSSADAPNPNSIVQRRSTDNGKTWGPWSTIAAGFTGDSTTSKYGYSDPSYVVDAQAGNVFAFSVYSKDAGFASSQYGNDDADRNIISSAVTESDDGGLTWGTPRLITSVTKPGTSKTSPQPGDVRSNFASSGEGIQLKYGPHAGRLIQQYAGYVRQANGSEALQAYSVYSDDHGATWQKGTPVGTGMDENKVVELSDGRVMLNSRDSSNGGYRKVAISTDGGATYGPVTADAELPDPANNGSITRLFPEAPAGSADAKKLLFTNANSQTGRENVSARVSCDDGATWPSVRTLRSGFSAYSTATRVGDGRIGVFYEADYTAAMEFASFDDAWLNDACAPVAAGSVNVSAGATVQVPVTVTNQEAAALIGATATVYTPSGWAATTVPVPDVAPGASATVSVTLTAPSGASGPTKLQAAFTTSDGRVAQGTFTATAPLVAQVGLTIAGTSGARDVVTSPYQMGEKVPYTLKVTSTASVAADAVPVSGTFDDAGYLPPASPNCRYRNLAAGSSYTCTTAKHTVTAEDVARGYFVPKATLSITAVADATVTKTVDFTGAPVFVRDPAALPIGATVTGARNDAGRDLAAQPYQAGEQVPWTFSVANSSPFTETVAPTAGNFAPLVPPGSGNCRWTNLAPFAGYDCATPRHTVTADEAAAGFFVPQSTWSATAAGKTPVTIEDGGDEVDLTVRAPKLDGTVAASWIDVDGDKYASAGDQIAVTSTVGNAGNVSLTGLTADGASFPASDLALGASSVAQATITLTQADVDAGTVAVPGFTATAHNGSKDASVTVAPSSLSLALKPAKPAAEPPVARADYDGTVSPVDLGLAFKYRAGQKVTLENLPYGQWYYLYVTGTGQRLGWFFPTLGNEVSLILPEGTKNGADTLVVLDSEGRQEGFGTLHVTPKGML